MNPHRKMTGTLGPMLVAALASSFALFNAWGAAASIPVPLDPAFGTSGGYSVLSINQDATEDEPFELIRQPDGKFLAAGKSYNGPAHNTDFTVIRWNADGTPDSGFGTGGYARADFFGNVDEGLSVALQADGKILIGGTVFNPITGNSDMGLARFNADGTLDTTFATYGADGVATVDFTGGSDQALGVALLPDGKIVLAGYATIFGRPYDFALARFNADGSLDTTFGLNGYVATDISGGQDIIFKLRIQPDGKMVAGGMSYNTQTKNFDFAVARYLANGQLDGTFSPSGKPGVETLDFQGLDDIGFSIILRYDGKIIMGGLAKSPTTGFDMGIAQFNQNGTLDTSFAVYGKRGVVSTDFSGGYDQALALAIQPDGKILAAGHTVSPTTGFDYALARYLPNGDIDTSFGNGGRVSTDFFGGPDGAHGLALLPDGKAVLVGDGYNPATGGDDIILAGYLVADPSWVQGTIYTMPSSAFVDGTVRNSMLATLGQVTRDINANNYAAALTRLNDLRARVDGCGAGPDTDDWIVDCTSQATVRASLTQIIGKLGG